MVLMNVKLDNFLVFNDFELCMSYPKKIVGSTIPSEHLSGRPNFRYKKVVVLMGANATGKTALGKILASIFYFITYKESGRITSFIENKSKDARFEVDLAFENKNLFRVSALFKARDNASEDYKIGDIIVSVKSGKILSDDSYESCIKRVFSEEQDLVNYHSYIAELEKVPPMTWMLEDTGAMDKKQYAVNVPVPELYCSVLEKTLKALDSRVIRVERIGDEEKAYVIKYPNNTVILKDNDSIGIEKMSSGTIEGIGIAELITVMKLGICDFYYCDEKFSHIHSDAERAFLSVLIDLLRPDTQLIFTSHDPDLLDMDLPKHSFAFLRRDYETNDISCVFASDYLKKNTDSLRNAVENDLFSAAPDVARIYDLASKGV